MDNRLKLFFGQRVSRLRRQDLPEVAYALTLASRNRIPVSFGRDTLAGADVVTVTSEWFALTVLATDWVKIEPYIRDGDFTVAAKPGASTQDVQVRPDPAQISTDPLYKRILHVLTLEFPDSYPKANR